MNILSLILFCEKEQIPYKENFSLKTITFTNTGGTVDLFVQPKNKADIAKLMNTINELNIPFMVIGNASNLIISDIHLKGIVISLSEINSIKISNDSISVGAGALLADVSKAATKHSLTGLEFACGIPGSIGGAVCMNAGAYGGEMKDVIENVTVLTSDGSILNLNNSELAFRYRHSNIKDFDYVVLETTFRLEKGNHAVISNKVSELTYLRESNQPLEHPSCGSVFKRPQGYFAGALIQNADLQGYRIGGVEVSTKHAGFMVNIDNGSATDYINLIQYVRQKVKEHSGVALETEVKIINSL